MTTKVCRKCGEAKDLSSFGRRKDSRDGRRSECKSCMNEYKLNRAIAARGYVKRDSIPKEEQRRRKQISSRAWREKRSDHIKNQRKRWHLENKDNSRRLGRMAAEKLSDRYVRNVIAGSNRELYKAIPQSLIEAKRIQLQVKRLIKEKTK